MFRRVGPASILLPKDEAVDARARPAIDTSTAIDHNNTSNDHAPRLQVMDCSTFSAVCMTLSYHYLPMTNVAGDLLTFLQTKLTDRQSVGTVRSVSHSGIRPSKSTQDGTRGRCTNSHDAGALESSKQVPYPPMPYQGGTSGYTPTASGHPTLSQRHSCVRFTSTVFAHKQHQNHCNGNQRQYHRLCCAVQPQCDGTIRAASSKSAAEC